ncbi:C40 family peptidase [Streptomyces sp. NPDC005438]|uniref:C40 family peptidase n=1 Tax=Streptomyces sp. NPDC005438 TaxID=3156880 RepID=UPI0033A6E2D0
MSEYTTSASALLSRVSAVATLTVAAVAGPTLVGVAPAEAAPSHTEAVRVAASKKGSPYQWGGNGPSRFDCSGLVRYAFKRLGKSLPRTAADQYRNSTKVPASSRRLGDLVFFPRNGTISHVGIYAGKGRIWHAPKPGAVVRLEKIWTKSVRYGRVR